MSRQDSIGERTDGTSSIRRLVAALLLATSLSWCAVAEPQGLDRALPEEVAKALTKAAPYLESSGDAAGRLLEQLGYGHPGIQRDVWRAFPPVRKLETAYLAATNAEAGGGERLLALLSRSLAQQYEPAAQDPAIAPYLQRATTGAAPLRFSSLTPDSTLAQLTDSARAVIDALAQYCEGGGFGPRAVLVNYFQLESSSAYEILRTSRSTNEVLHRGILAVDDSRRDAAMARLVHDLDDGFESATHVREFDPWRRGGPRMQAGPLPPFPWSRPGDVRPWRPDDGPGASGSSFGRRPTAGSPGPKAPSRDSSGGSATSSGSGSVSGTGGPTWGSHGSTGYTDSVNRWYGGGGTGSPGGGGLGFTSVVQSPGGFGGVVLGNEVTDVGLPGVRKLSWEGGDRDVGSIAVEFADGTSAMLTDVRREDAYAARQIVFTGLDGEPADSVLGPAKAGNAIGLVGIHDSVPYFDCGPESLLHEGRRWKVVMHPAIAELELGWACLLTDVLPLGPSHDDVLELIRARSGDDVANELEAVWDRGSTYKFVDVPMRVSVENGSLTVRSATTPEAANSSGILTLHSFSRRLFMPADFDDTSAMTNLPLITALAQVAPEVARVSDFARVLGVYRWAKAKGARMEGDIPPPQFGPRAASIIVAEDGYAPAADFTPEAARAELMDKLALRLAQLRLTGCAGMRKVDEAYSSLAQLDREESAGFGELNSLGPRIQSLLLSGIDALDDATAKRLETLHQTESDSLSAYLNAPADSPEETLALARMEQAESDIQSLVARSIPGLLELQTVFEKTTDQLEAIDGRQQELHEKIKELGAMASEDSACQHASYFLALHERQRNLRRDSLDLVGTLEALLR